MIGFIGKYEYQMDEKGRVSLPSALRRGADSDRFVLLQWEKPFLSLFPESAWLEVQEKLVDIRRRKRGSWNKIREIVSNAVEVSPDKQGRILVPSWLQGAAGLSGSVLITGFMDRIELWDPEVFRKTIEEAETDEGIEDFKYELFG